MGGKDGHPCIVSSIPQHRIILQNGKHFVFLDAPVSLVDWISLHDGGVKELCEVKTFVAFTFLFPIFEYFSTLSHNVALSHK